MTCSRTQPPARILVLESEKLHLRFGTTPLSVLWAPRLSGFCKSIWLFVPPGTISHTKQLYTVDSKHTKNRSAFPFVIYGLPLGELLPLAEIGSCSSNSGEKTKGAKLHLEIPAKSSSSSSSSGVSPGGILSHAYFISSAPRTMRARSPYLRAGVKTQTI